MNYTLLKHLKKIKIFIIYWNNNKTHTLKKLFICLADVAHKLLSLGVEFQLELPHGHVGA